jgi:hypothetical protein
MHFQQRRLVWPGLAALSGALAAAPLWCSHFLPYQDAPQHLAAVTLLAQTGREASLTRPWFEIGFAHAQYTGFYVPAMWLARLFGPDAAIRILLTLVALFLPYSAWQLLRAFGRDVRLSVFAAPLFHTAPLYIGVYNFVAAVPVALLVIALVERQLQAPRWPRALLLGALSVMLLFLHLSGLVIAVGAACALAVTANGPLRERALRGLLPLAPAMAMLTLLRAPAARPAGSAAGAMKEGPIWQAPWYQARDLLRAGNVLPGRVDELVVAGLAVLWLLLAFSARQRFREERAFRLPLLAGGLLVAYFAAPMEIGYIAYIHLRAIPFLLMFAICSVAVAQTRRSSVLFCTAVALQAAYAVKLVRSYRDFDAEASALQLQQVLSAARPGQRMVSLMLDRKSRAVHFEPYLHFGLYYEVLRGGRVRFNFGELPWMPLRFRRDRPAQPFPLRWEFEPAWFDWGAARNDADYVFVRTPDPHADAADDPEPGPPFADGWDLQARAGRWALFAQAREDVARRPQDARKNPQSKAPTSSPVHR